MENAKAKVFKIRTGEWYRNEAGICCLSYNEGAYTTLEDAKETVRTSLNLQAYEGEKMLVFIDSKGSKGSTKEAREYLAKAETAKATAVLVESGMSRVLGNFFITLSRPKYPMKLFSSREKAIEWLESFK